MRLYIILKSMITNISNRVNAKSIWISDVHLGSVGSQKNKLFSFLDNISCENLFLNGYDFTRNITEIVEASNNIKDDLLKVFYLYLLVHLIKSY